MNPFDFLVLLARSSTEAGVLILLVLGTQWLFRKQLTPRWHCMLWLLVIARLVPFSLSSATSVFNLAPRWPENVTFVTRVNQDPVVELPLKTEAPILPKDPRSSAVTHPWNGQPSGSALADIPVLFRPTAGQTVPRSHGIHWTTSLVLFVLWAAGAVSLLTHITVTCVRFARRLRRSKAITDPAILAVLSDACGRLKVRRAPRLVESDAVTSPALQGFLRPTLLLPSNFVSNFSLQEIGFVFLHELAHLQRHDLALNGLATLLQVVHWFNPLIWFGLARWRVDREIACDALALDARGAADHLDYGRTILRLVDRRAVFAPTPGLVGIMEDPRQLRRRIGMIAAYVRRPRWSLAGIAALGILAAVGLTDAQGDSAHSPASDPSLPKTRPLKITVLDGTTGQPVEGATVVASSLLDWNHPSAETGGRQRTNSSGEAVFSVPLGNRQAESEQTFNVNVTHPGFATREVMWISDAGNVRESLDESYVVRIQSGMTVGGYVRDQQGKPIVGAAVAIEGSNYRGFRVGSGIKEKQEYAQIDSAPIETDDNGFWHAENVPTEVTEFQLVVTRPGGARTKFATPPVDEQLSHAASVVSYEDLKAKQALFTLNEGVTLRGTVHDEAGQSLNGVRLRVQGTDEPSGTRPFETTIDGHFELPHWTNPRVLVTAECKGYATTSITLKSMADMPEARLVMPKAKGLRVHLLNEKDEPIEGAEFRIVSYRSGEQLLDWHGKTNAEGRIEWSNAPETPVTFIILARSYPERTVQLSGDGIEHLVRLKKGENERITFALEVIDAGTGRPVERFDVLGRIANDNYRVWDEPPQNGVFKKELPQSLFPKRRSESYHVQVRSPGYEVWTSDRLEFSDGDQDLTIRLKKGFSLFSKNEVNLNPRSVANDETDPSLVPIGTAVAQLLETQDVTAFVDGLCPRLEDWNGVLPPEVNATENPLGKDPAARLRAHQKDLTASANRVVELAKRIGLEKGRVHFSVKSMAGRAGSARLYKLSGKTLKIPYIGQLQIVLTAEPADGNPPKKETLGDYVLSLSDMMKFSKGWRVEKGIRWRGLPPDLADEATLRDLELLNKITGTSLSSSSGPITALDDDALNQVALNVIALLQGRDSERFVAACTLSRKDMEEFLVGHVGQPASAVESAYQHFTTSASGAAASLLSQLDQLGIVFSDAQITVKRAIAEQPFTPEFGSLEGVRSRSLQITLAVMSPRTSKSGASLSGEYTVALEKVMRFGGRWVVTDSKARWQEFPAGLLGKEEIKTVELENYIAENHALPPGFAAPDIDLVRLADQTSTKLSAFRGKVVILDFWASWCGPCQEPMREMQKLAASHPEWKDRVEIVTVSIDNKSQDASEHLAKRGWNKTLNTWVGDGGFKSSPAQAFRVNGVPTTYVLGTDGKIIVGGHPAGMDFATIVNSALR